MVLGCYFGTYMRFPVVPLYAQSLGADTVMVGLINAAFLLSAGALSLPLGLVVNRLGMKLLAGVGLLILGRSSFLLAVSSTPHQLFWIYLFSGAGLAAFGPTTMSYVAGISPPTTSAGPMAGTPRRSMSAWAWGRQPGASWPRPGDFPWCLSCRASVSS